MNSITINNLYKEYNNGSSSLKVLEDISIKLNEGEFVSLIGPSGCGKSTVFNIICGIEKQTSGNIEFSKATKCFGMMPQKDLLMDWKTLLENLILPLTIQGENKKTALIKVEKMLPDFGLQGFEKAYPNELSGGMRQRAALLRTLLIKSPFLLLDEPFGALDALTREDMQEWLLNIWEKNKKSVLFITHSIDEAIFLSDRIYVLSPRPATIKKEIKIDFERPRSKKITTTLKFLEYKSILISELSNL
jgi:putative hydroxymethylpyrimidine transport system ATP-binding protein